MIADLEMDVGHVKKVNQKSSGWKFCDAGFEKYFVESEPSLVFEKDGLSSTKVYESWTVAFEKLLARCFSRRPFTAGGGKVDMHCGKHKHIRTILSEISKKGKIQREVAKQYQCKLVEVESFMMAEARAERLKKTTTQLTLKEKFSPVGYWKMKKAADRGIRKEQTLSSIMASPSI